MTTRPPPGPSRRAWPRRWCTLLNEVGANPGRAGHRLAVEAGRIVYGAREAVCELFHAPDPLRVVFGTERDRGAQPGAARPAASRRPRDHQLDGAQLDDAPPARAGARTRQGRRGDGGALLAAGRPGSRPTWRRPSGPTPGWSPSTTPPTWWARCCRWPRWARSAAERDLLLLVDAAQTGGAYPIDVQADRIDLLAFTGHKSLGGPMGTGGPDRGRAGGRAAAGAADARRHGQPLGARGAARLSARHVRERHAQRGGPGRAGGGRALGAGTGRGGHPRPRGRAGAAADRRACGAFPA